MILIMVILSKQVGPNRGILEEDTYSLLYF